MVFSRSCDRIVDDPTTAGPSRFPSVTVPAMTDAVRYSLDGDVAVVSFDDGKANVLTHAVLDALGDALGRAAAEARALVVIGREGRFSAGFDLSVMTSGIEPMGELLGHGFEVAHAVFTSPVPVVLGCTGHALAMGAILLLVADVRVGAEGPYKIGLNEVAIGMPMPRFGVAAARERLAPPQLDAAVQLATIYEPSAAVGVGYLDLVCPAPAVAGTAVAQARDLAARLDPAAFRLTRMTLRGPQAQAFRQAFDEDKAGLRAGQV
jgi:enoyl-CoA hydratase